MRGVDINSFCCKLIIRDRVAIRHSRSTAERGSVTGAPTQTSVVQTALWGTYLGNGVWAPPTIFSKHATATKTILIPIPVLFAEQGCNCFSATKTPQLSRCSVTKPPATPSYNALIGKLPLRPWSKSVAGQKRPHSEAFGSNRPFGNQAPSLYTPRLRGTIG